MAWTILDNFLLSQEDGANIDLNTDALKIALLNVSYVPNQATDILFASISSNEVSGTNYTAGGDALTAPTVTLSAGTVTFDGPDNVWAQSGSGFTNARIVVIYSTVNDRIIAYHDLVSDKGNVAGSFTIEMDAAGIFTKTSS